MLSPGGFWEVLVYLYSAPDRICAWTCICIYGAQCICICGATLRGASGSQKDSGKWSKVKPGSSQGWVKIFTLTFKLSQIVTKSKNKYRKKYKYINIEIHKCRSSQGWVKIITVTFKLSQINTKIENKYKTYKFSPKDGWWPVNTGDKDDSPKICEDDDDVNDQDDDVDGGVDVVDGGVDVVWVKIFATTFKWSGSGRSVWATVSQVCLFPTIDKNTSMWKKKY